MYILIEYVTKSPCCTAGISLSVLSIPSIFVVAFISATFISSVLVFSFILSTTLHTINISLYSASVASSPAAPVNACIRFAPSVVSFAFDK